MRTFPAIAAAIVVAALTAGSPAHAAPSDRTAPNFTNGSLIRLHDCQPGAEYGNGINGWLRDDTTVPGRKLVYVDIDHATNGTWRWQTLYSCHR